MLALDNAQKLGVGGQISDHIIGLATRLRLREEIQTAIDHFNGDAGERLVERFSDRIGKIH